MALVFKKVTEYDWEVTVQSPDKGKFKKETYEVIKKMPRVRTLDAIGGIRTHDVFLTSHIATVRLFGKPTPYKTLF